MHFIRRSIIAGLLFWLPIWVTLLVIRFLIDILDRSVALLPRAYQPEYLFGFHVPGLGLVISVAIVFITGILVTNFMGRKLVHWGETLVARIPLIGSIYNAVKQVSMTLLSKDNQSFKKVFLIEYPRKGIWSIGFQTGVCTEEISKHTGGETLTIFIPTTPNPTSGFIIIVPRSQAIELKMSVEQALKFIISLGVVQPVLPSPMHYTDKLV